jgi:hypothetical protein
MAFIRGDELMAFDESSACHSNKRLTPASTFTILLSFPWGPESIRSEAL